MATAEEFIGLQVSIDLKDGHLILGTIENVSAEANLLLLSGVDVLNRETGDRSTFPRLEVAAEQISSLKLVKPSKVFTTATGTRAVDSQKPSSLPRPLPNANANPANGTRPRSQTSTPRKKQTGQSGWMEDDVKKYKNEEFDFEENLKLFDKKTIFDEIRMQDATRPEDRLVAHNLAQRKLRPDQMVLERRDQSAGGDEGDEDEILIESLSIKSQSGKSQSTQPKMIPPPPRSYPSTSMMPNHPPSSSLKSGLLSPRQTATSLSLSSVPLPKSAPIFDTKLVADIEQKVVLTGMLSNEQLMENAARSFLEFMLTLERSLLKESKNSSILLVVGMDRIASYMIATARHLHNRGFSVLLHAPSDLRMAPGFVNAALRQYQKHGGRVIHSFNLTEGGDKTTPEPSVSLLITSTVFVVPKKYVHTPCLSLVDGMPGKWSIRFGLPHSVSLVESANRPIVLCDIGLPPPLVNETLGETFYDDLFTESSFILLEPTI